MSPAEPNVWSLAYTIRLKDPQISSGKCCVMNQLLHDTHLSLLEEELDTVAELSWPVPTLPQPNLQQTDKVSIIQTL